jgi:transcriptional regulator with XRE-family HTH domain
MDVSQFPSFDDVLSEELQNPAFRKEWERLAPARAVANSMVAYRVQHGLTQTALARILGISQPAVARIEIGEHLPTLDTLMKLSERLDLEFSLTLIPGARAKTDRERLHIEERIVTAQGVSLEIAIR